MTPQSLIIDRHFKGVGRIKRAVDSTNPDIRRRYNEMLTALRADARIDILRAIRDGVLSLPEAYDAYRRRQLDQLATGETAKALLPAYDAWREALRVPDDVSAKHHVSLGTSRNYLAGVKLRGTPKPRVADLPRVVTELRVSLGAKHPRSFNLARAAVLAFLRQTLTRAHPLWLSVAAIEPRKVRRSREGRPLSPAQLRNWFPHPDTDPTDAIAWGMAVTGMGEKEYWGEWSVESDRVRIRGTKRAGRDRVVPLVRAPAVPTIHSRTFTDKLRERTDRSIQPYDLRRTYAHWMEEAGVPRTRRKLYMGHGAGDVTGIYELHEVAQFVAEDGSKLRRFIEKSHRKPHTKPHTKKGGLRAV